MYLDSITRRTRFAIRRAFYVHGAATTFAHVRELAPGAAGDRFVCEQAELIGFPVWSSSPVLGEAGAEPELEREPELEPRDEAKASL